MTDEVKPPLKTADVRFAKLVMLGQQRVIAGALFEGVLVVGVGVDNRTAIEDLMRRAFPSMKSMSYGPQAAWNPIVAPGVTPDTPRRKKEFKS